MDNQTTRVVEIGAVNPGEIVSETVGSPGTSAEPGSNLTETSKGTSTNSEAKSIYELLEEDIMASDTPDSEKTKRLSRLIKIRSKKVNIMLVGSTGSGKSSTVNAMFNMDIAKVGVGVDPETSDISKFELDNLIIWDSGI